MTPCTVRLTISAAHSSPVRYSEVKGRAAKSGPDGASRRSAGSPSRSVGRPEPGPASGRSQPSSSPAFQRIAHSVRTAREAEACDGPPPEAPHCTSRGRPRAGGRGGGAGRAGERAGGGGDGKTPTPWVWGRGGKGGAPGLPSLLPGGHRGSQAVGVNDLQARQVDDHLRRADRDRRECG